MAGALDPIVLNAQSARYTPQKLHGVDTLSGILKDMQVTEREDALRKQLLAEKAEERAYQRGIDKEKMGWLRDEQANKKADRVAADKAKADKAAYLKGMSDPNAYGLKVGREALVRDLGGLTADDMYKDAPADIKALIKRDIGSKSDLTDTDQSKLDSYYNTTADRMAEMMKGHIGYGIDDIATGLATSMPDNAYAAEEAIKANVSRRKALTDEIARRSKEATTLEGDRLKYLGKAADKAGTGGSTSSKEKITPSTIYEGIGLDKKDQSAEAKNIRELVLKGVDAGLSQNQILGALNELKYDKAYDAPALHPFKWDKDAKLTGTDKVTARMNELVKENKAAKAADTNEAYTDWLGGQSKANRDALAGLQAQLEGRAGVDDLAKVLSRGFGDKGVSANKKQEQVRLENMKEEKKQKKPENGPLQGAMTRQEVLDEILAQERPGSVTTTKLVELMKELGYNDDTTRENGLLPKWTPTENIKHRIDNVVNSVKEATPAITSKGVRTALGGNLPASIHSAWKNLLNVGTIQQPTVASVSIPGSPERPNMIATVGEELTNLRKYTPGTFQNTLQQVNSPEKFVNAVNTGINAMGPAGAIAAGIGLNSGKVSQLFNKYRLNKEAQERIANKMLIEWRRDPSVDPEYLLNTLLRSN
jgi:hypothetical protein